MQEDFLEYYGAIQRGQKLLELRRPAEALTIFQEALHLSSGRPHAFEGMAIAYRELGQTAKAQDCIKQGLAIAPDRASLFHQQGGIYYEQEQYSKAIQSLQEAARLEPNNEDYQVALVSALEGRGRLFDVIKAARLLEKNLQTNPTSVPALRKQALASLEVSRYKEAKKYVDRLALLDPNDPIVRLVNAEFDQRYGHGGLAREQYRAILQEEPGDTNLLYLFYETYAYSSWLWRSVARFIPLQVRTPVVVAAATFGAAICIFLLISKSEDWLDPQVAQISGLFLFIPFLVYWVARVPSKWLSIWREQPYIWGWRERSFLFLDLSGAVAAISLFLFFITFEDIFGTTAFFLFLYGGYVAALVFAIPIPYQSLAISILAFVYLCGIINFVAVILGHRPPRITDLVTGFAWLAMPLFANFFSWLDQQRKNNKTG